MLRDVRPLARAARLTPKSSRREEMGPGVVIGGKGEEVAFTNLPTGSFFGFLGCFHWSLGTMGACSPAA